MKLDGFTNIAVPLMAQILRVLYHILWGGLSICSQTDGWMIAYIYSLLTVWVTNDQLSSQFYPELPAFMLKTAHVIAWCLQVSCSSLSTYKADDNEIYAHQKIGEKAREASCILTSSYNTHTAGISVVIPCVGSTGVASIFSLNEVIKEAVGCVKIIGYRNSSFMTFWWSLLALTATGTQPCLNYTGWQFSKQWQVYKHHVSGLQCHWNVKSA